MPSGQRHLLGTRAVEDGSLCGLLLSAEAEGKAVVVNHSDVIKEEQQRESQALVQVLH